MVSSSIEENSMSGDWRLQGQERFLKGAVLTWRSYSPYREDWEHDHCEFCGRKFSMSPGDLRAGYATENRYHWICEDCFHDFAKQFEWIVR